MTTGDPIQQGRDNWVLQESGRVMQISSATALIRGAQVIQARAAAIVHPSRVTSAQLEVLVALDCMDGPSDLSGLAQELSLHPTTVARTVTRLARRGYASRTQSPSDGRAAVVSITESGRDVVEEALGMLSAVRFGIAGWDVSDARRFRELVAPILSPSPEPSSGPAGTQER